MRRWTSDDDARLLELVAGGASERERAAAMGVTVGSARARLTKIRSDSDVDIPITFEEPEPAPGATERILFVPDTHAPFVDERAWSTMIAAARTWRPHRVFVLGDMADFYAVSDHDKSPGRRQNLKWEVAETNKRLDELDTLGAVHKHFISGNHENRLQRHLAKHAPALFDMFDIPSLFRLSDRRWTFTDYGDSYKLGHLYVTHDEDNAGPYAHIRARSTFGANAVIGHTHRMAISYQGNAAGKSHVGAMFGWLGDLGAIDYAKRVKSQQWQHGFGIGHMFPSGDVHLRCIPIVNGTCVVEGVAA